MANKDLRGVLIASTLAEFGGTVLELDNDHCVIRYIVTERHCNPRGTLQGGMFSVYLDDAMGYAMVSRLGEDARFATTDLSVHYLREVRPGVVIAEGKIVRLGRRSAYLEGEVRTEDGKLCARGSSTVMRLN